MAEYTKTRDRRGPRLLTYKVTYLPTGNVTDQSKTQSMGKVESATADWRRPYPIFIRDNTYMFVRIVEDGLNWGDTSRTVGYYSTECRGHAQWLATHPPSGVAVAFNRTVSEDTAEAMSIVAYAKARGKLHGSQIDLGETLGGARQTVQMVTKAIKNVDSLIQKVAAKDWTGIADMLHIPRSHEALRKAAGKREFADAWLELQFGWEPLIQDVHDGINSYGKSLKKGQQVRSRSGYLPKGEGSSAHDVFGGKAGVSGTVSSAWGANLNAYGISNPALTAWQLLPLSFVVDWFLPVSHYLAGLTASAGMSALVGWRVSCHGTESGWTPYGVYKRTRNVVRSPVVGLAPIPSGRMYLPFRDSVSKMTTALALARQRIDGAPVKYRTGKWPRKR